jgi:hypothetical protein
MSSGRHAYEETDGRSDDVAYAESQWPRPALDVYEADSQHDQRTAVLLVHGGGWKRGDRKMLAAHAALLARRGHCVACEYRLLGESPWPGCRRRPRGDRVGAQPRRRAGDRARPDRPRGHSGGHLSLAAGTAQDDGRRRGGRRALRASHVPSAWPRPRYDAGLALLGDDVGGRRARSLLSTSLTSADVLPARRRRRIVVPSASVVMYEAPQSGVDTDLHLSRAGPRHRVDTACAGSSTRRSCCSSANGLQARRDREQIAEQNPFATTCGRVGR